ncbi:MAG: hypothetical protein R3233_02040 [Xanthomonadales bacterium]|nr:hypothetical protein [Xanthomonadales bacterium]
MNRMRNSLTRPAHVLAIAGCMMLASTAWSGAAVADEPNPYLKADDTWISISGTVDVVHPNSFVLDYGDGMVKVEMDDGDRDADAYKLLKGDKVTVSGRIDDDFFEMTKIEASSVFVENLGTTFYASSVDEEAYEGLDPSAIPPVMISRTVVRGEVTKVDGDEFVVDTGARHLRVDVSGMSFDPLDDEGYLKIEAGDTVKVIGQIGVDLFEGRELRADSVVKIYTASS